MNIPTTTAAPTPATADGGGLPAGWAVTTVQITETTTYDVLVAHPPGATAAAIAAAGYEDYTDTAHPDRTFPAVPGEDEISIEGRDHTDDATAARPSWGTIHHATTRTALEARTAPADRSAGGGPGGSRAWRTILGRVVGGRLDWWGSLSGIAEDPVRAAMLAGPAPFAMAFESDDVESAVAMATEEVRWTRFAARHLVTDHPERGWCVRDLHQFSRVVTAWPDPPHQLPGGDPTDPAEQPRWHDLAVSWADELNHAHRRAVTGEHPDGVVFYPAHTRDGVTVSAGPARSGDPAPGGQDLTGGYRHDEAALAALYCMVLNGALEDPGRP